jgi:transposase
MPAAVDIDNLNESQLRELVAQMQQALGDKDTQLQELDTTIQRLGDEKDAQLQERDAAIHRLNIEKEHLTHEIAILRRYRYGKRSETKGRSPQQSLLDELVDEDLAALDVALESLTEAQTAPTRKTAQPRRQPLPAQLPRTDIHHDPESTACGCGCELTRIGEDVSEKLDYEPGQFSVERHIRSKWACRQCETVIQAPVAPHIIDKGIPTTNLLAQVLISKYADHLPLYRQEQIYARAGVDLPRSTLADWVGRCGVELAPLVERLRACLLGHAVLHADETPVPMLSPGKKKTHRAYIWAYATPHAAPVQAVVYDFQPTRSGQACRDFLADWQGHLVCDDYQGYKAGFATGITEVGCWAHARRKFFELAEHGNSPIADQALISIGTLYDIEREIVDKPPDERQRLRETQSRPIIAKLREWLIHQRAGLTDGTRTARAIDYSLKRWEALICYLDDGAIPIDNNWIENLVRPWALGRKNWLFAGSKRSGQRAANIMSLIQSAKINGLDPQAYLRDVLERLPTTKYSDIDSLLPHNWAPPIKV